MHAATFPASDQGFRHEALFYAGEDDFVRRAGAFIRDGLAADEPILVVVSGRKIQLLRSELGADSDRVRFADISSVGRNPARIIPAWREFVDENAPSGRPFRGIGEPIYPTRSRAELVECERHEALLNVAFDGSGSWWLLCPYDTAALPAAVLEEARRNHPFLAEDDAHRRSSVYVGTARFTRPFDRSLPEPAGDYEELLFGPGDLEPIRYFVGRRAGAFGLGAERTADLVLAVDELASNTMRHANGAGRLRVWRERDTLLCEVADEGRIDDPLVGRNRPMPYQEGGIGLWLVTQLCDLVQIRTFATGSVVRVEMRRG